MSGIYQSKHSARTPRAGKPAWLIIFRKEWRELLRDGRSLTYTLLLPMVAVPAAILLFGIETETVVPARRGMPVFLPVFLTLFCFVGCMYPAIDTFAGEKERRTLETLWLTPVSRAQLTIGKVLLCTSTGWLAAVLGLFVACVGGWCLAGLGDSNFARGQSWASSVSNLTVASVLWTCVWLAPLAIAFAAGLVTISAKAGSFKEAQAMMNPFYIGIFLAMTPIFLWPDLASGPNAWRWATVPMLNVLLSIQQQLRQKLSLSFAGLTVVSSLLVATALLLLCLRYARQERSIQ